MPTGVYKRTKEHRDKLRQTAKRLGIRPPPPLVGRTVSQVTRIRIGLGRRGKMHTQETKDLISLRGLGRKHSEKTKAKMSNSKIGHVVTKETREKIGKSNSGENCNWWKGGVTRENERIRKTAIYYEWRRAVFFRDGWTCVLCRKFGGVLNADHIKPFAHFPELRFEVKNGRTLCIKCHRNTPTFGNKPLNRFLGEKHGIFVP